MEDRYSCAECGKEVKVERTVIEGKGAVTIVQPCTCNKKIRMEYQEVVDKRPVWRSVLI